jgi:outer membrane protein OmpA-like peptidoglycan-associated protein
MHDLRLPDGVTLQLPDSSFLNAIYKYLSDTTATKSRQFVFEGLEFDDARVRALPETDTAVTNLTKLIRAFPSVTLRIEGHTDPSGDSAADQKRSLARADAVKDLLVKAGVPSDRLTTAGLGSEHPVASNDTAEGRARNRRIELSLSKSS